MHRKHSLVILSLRYVIRMTFRPSLLVPLALIPVAAALQAPQVHAADPVVINCAGKQERRPSSIQFGCATGSVMLANLRWSSWDSNNAMGQGDLVVNSCIYKGGPSCVEGQTMTYPANVILGRPASGPGITSLSEVRLRFTDGGPAGLWGGTYRLDNPLRP